MYKKKEDLIGEAKVYLDFLPDGVIIRDSRGLESLIDRWVYTFVFSNDDELKGLCRFLIRSVAEERGIYPASIYEFYKGVADGEYGGFSVPAINIRGLTYDVGRRAMRVAKKLSTQAFVLEIARSEIGYTYQSPEEYATVLLAAAVREGHKGPLFFQGDHYQVKRDSYLKDPDKETDSLKNLIEKSIEAGFYNIDIDASTLVDISKEDLRAQQRLNAHLTAVLTEFIRGREPEGITVSLGGEIGEIGGKNSTAEDLVAFMDEYLERLNRGPGIIKIAVQTGTRHGGVVLPNGTLKQVKVDFDTIKTLSALSRERYGLAGVVQHGASTLPLNMFHLFPQNGALEIHLATQFQNLIYDSPELPRDFKEKIYSFLKENFSKEWRDDETEEQFIYKTRKKGFGPFKWEWWNLPEKEVKDPILDRIEKLFMELFKALRVDGTKELVSKKVKPLKDKLTTPMDFLEVRG